MALDKNKPYGEVCGSGSAKYEQDGRFYNPQGLEVTIDGELLEAEETPKKRGPKPQVQSEVEAQIEANMQG